MLEESSHIQPRPILQKGHIILRPPRPSDLQQRLAYGEHPEINRMYGGSIQHEKPMPEEKALNWYRQMCRDQLRWVIEVNGTLAGITGLHSLNREDRRARFVIGLLHPNLLNRGTGTIATRLVLQYAFEKESLHRVDLRVLAFNERAIVAYRKCGFVQEGIERDSAWVNGNWADDIIMSILEPEYRALMPAWDL